LILMALLQTEGCSTSDGRCGSKRKEAARRGEAEESEDGEPRAEGQHCLCECLRISGGCEPGWSRMNDEYKCLVGTRSCVRVAVRCRPLLLARVYESVVNESPQAVREDSNRGVGTGWYGLMEGHLHALEGNRRNVALAMAGE
jgi:hypothetical protein